MTKSFKCCNGLYGIIPLKWLYRQIFWKSTIFGYTRKIKTFEDKNLRNQNDINATLSVENEKEQPDDEGKTGIGFGI